MQGIRIELYKVEQGTGWQVEVSEFSIASRNKALTLIELWDGGRLCKGSALSRYSNHCDWLAIFYCFKAWAMRIIGISNVPKPCKAISALKKRKVGYEHIFVTTPYWGAMTILFGR